MSPPVSLYGSSSMWSSLDENMNRVVRSGSSSCTAISSVKNSNSEPPALYAALRYPICRAMSPDPMPAGSEPSTRRTRCHTTGTRSVPAPDSAGLYMSRTSG